MPPGNGNSIFFHAYLPDFIASTVEKTAIIVKQISFAGRVKILTIFIYLVCIMQTYLLAVCMKRIITFLIISSVLFACAKKSAADKPAPLADNAAKTEVKTDTVAEVKTVEVKNTPAAKPAVPPRTSSMYGFSGRIIDVTEQFVVIKSGYTEKKYYLDDESHLYDQAGDGILVDELWICHYAGVVGVEKGGKKYIKTLQIIKSIKCE